MYYLCGNIIKPLTKPSQLSYADVVGPNDMQWFVSHFWGTPFVHFVETIRKHAEGSLGARVTDLHLVTYWICTFSNNQWKVLEELGETWEYSSFFLALRSPGYKGTVMVLDDEVRPLTRSWCLFELLQTALLSKKKKTQGLFLATQSGVMNRGQCGMDLAVTLSKKMSTLKLQDASASSQDAWRSICINPPHILIYIYCMYIYFTVYTEYIYIFAVQYIEYRVHTIYIYTYPLYTSIHLSIDTYLHRFICQIHIYIYTHIHIYIYAHIHAYIHIYIYTNTNIYIYYI